MKTPGGLFVLDSLCSTPICGSRNPLAMPMSAFWARREFFVARISWLSSMAMAIASGRVSWRSAGAPVAGKAAMSSRAAITETTQVLTIRNLPGRRFYLVARVTTEARAFASARLIHDGQDDPFDLCRDLRYPRGGIEIGQHRWAKVLI